MSKRIVDESKEEPLKELDDSPADAMQKLRDVLGSYKFRKLSVQTFEKATALLLTRNNKV